MHASQSPLSSISLSATQDQSTDLYDLLDPVDMLAQIPENFYASMVCYTWCVIHSVFIILIIILNHYMKAAIVHMLACVISLMSASLCVYACLQLNAPVCDVSDVSWCMHVSVSVVFMCAHACMCV